MKCEHQYLRHRRVTKYTKRGKFLLAYSYWFCILCDEVMNLYDELIKPNWIEEWRKRVDELMIADDPFLAAVRNKR